MVLSLANYLHTFRAWGLINVASDPQYTALVAKPREGLSIKELILVSFYEHQIPAHKRAEEMQSKIATLTEHYELTKKEVCIFRKVLFILFLIFN